MAHLPTRTIEISADHLMVSPDGRRVKISATAFEAVRAMIEDRKQGSVTIHFLSGGIRSVRAETVYS